MVDRHLRPQHLQGERWDTVVGSILTQIVMIAAVVMIATTVGRVNPNQPLNNVAEIANGLLPFLGIRVAKVFFGLGLLGALSLHWWFL